MASKRRTSALRGSGAFELVIQSQDVRTKTGIFGARFVQLRHQKVDTLGELPERFAAFCRVPDKPIAEISEQQLTSLAARYGRRRYRKCNDTHDCELSTDRGIHAQIPQSAPKLNGLYGSFSAVQITTLNGCFRPTPAVDDRGSMPTRSIENCGSRSIDILACG